MHRLLVALLLIVAAPVQAQIEPQTTPVLPDITPEERLLFQTCRAAIFYHLADRAEHDRVPPAVAQAMLEQMSFVMSQTIMSRPNGSMEEGRLMLNFTENFFITFSAIIAERSDFAIDLSGREAQLLQCQPLLWLLVSQQIDTLLAERIAR